MIVVIAGVLHGLVGLAWAAGVRRAAGPLSGPAWADLLSLALALPPIAGIARLFGNPGDASLVRLELWADAARRTPGALHALGVLLGGTALLFLVQELPPVLLARRRRGNAARVADARLEASFARVVAAYRARGLWLERSRQPRVGRLETDELVAALDGLVDMEVLVSRGLMARLDDEELDATLAHELAHVVRGGNWRLSLLWLVRALQAPSPAALVLWRSYLEAQEVACDALASFVTGRPAALASALLKVHGDGGASAAGMGTIEHARQEVLRRADNVTTRRRVRLLLDRPATGRTPLLARVSSWFLLGAVLWSLG